MRLTCEAHDDIVSLTVDIDEAAVAEFVDSQRTSGTQFTAKALKKLGLRP